MIGSRTSMHTEFSTNFSTSHLTENCSNRFAAKIVGRGEVCDMGCGPGQVARHLPGIALADQESSGFKSYRFPQHVRGNSSQKACLHPRACPPGSRGPFYGTREEGHALEECGKSPEAARLDSAPSACVSTWECMGDKRSTVPISGCSNIP